jgi:hypothetical protein
MVIASAYRTENPGFDSLKDVRFLGICTLQCCCQSKLNVVSLCLLEKNKYIHFVLKENNAKNTQVTQVQKNFRDL